MTFWAAKNLIITCKTVLILLKLAYDNKGDEACYAKKEKFDML